MASKTIYVQRARNGKRLKCQNWTKLQIKWILNVVTQLTDYIKHYRFYFGLIRAGQFFWKSGRNSLKKSCPDVNNFCYYCQISFQLFGRFEMLVPYAVSWFLIDTYWLKKNHVWLNLFSEKIWTFPRKILWISDYIQF